MATVENLRNTLITKLMAVSDEDILNAVDKLLSTSSDNKQIELTKEQMLMIEISLQDLESGQTIPHNELFDQEREWLKTQ